MSRAHLHAPRHVGDTIADQVTAFVGSWRFVIVQALLMLAWVVYNVWMVFQWATLRPFDPFPFVFLNLFMSAEAAFSTPFILMSQNRAALRDRARDDLEAAEVGQMFALQSEIHTMNRQQLEILHLLRRLVPGETA